jgi:hypothetical protein
MREETPGKGDNTMKRSRCLSLFIVLMVGCSSKPEGVKFLKLKGAESHEPEVAESHKPEGVKFLKLKGAESHEPEVAEYFLFPAGHRNIYDVRIVDIPSHKIIKGTVIRREDGTVNIGGKTYHKKAITVDGIQDEIPFLGPDKVSYVYVRLAADGIYSRKSTDPKEPEILSIPLPVKVGRKWTVVQGGLREEMEISAVEDLDTAKKIYKRCIKITNTVIKTKERDGFIGRALLSHMEEGKSVVYYAPKIGLVKGEMFEFSGGGQRIGHISFRLRDE